ncbi:MAG: type II secretion system F family protein [Planctomycetota bacterium]
MTGLLSPSLAVALAQVVSTPPEAIMPLEVRLGLAALLAVAVALAALGSRSALERRLQSDRRWIERSATRFSSEPLERLIAPDLYASVSSWFPRLSAGMFYASVYNALRVLSLALLIALLPSWWIAAALWLALLWAPNVLVEWCWERRKAEIDRQLPQAASGMANNLASGLTLVQSIRRMSVKLPDPIRTEFRKMVVQYDLGRGLDETLHTAKAELNMPNFNLFASALLVNRELGGDVPRTLDRIARSLEKLQELRQALRSATAEGRTNIRVLTLAPAVVLIFIGVMDPEGLQVLFETPPGWAILILAAVLTALGNWIAHQILTQEL